MVDFWQILVLLGIFSASFIFAFKVGYNAGRSKENLIVEKNLPDIVSLEENEEDFE